MILDYNNKELKEIWQLGNQDISVSVLSNEKLIIKYLQDFFINYPNKKNNNNWIIKAVVTSRKPTIKNIFNNRSQVIRTELGEVATKIMNNGFCVIVPKITETYIIINEDEKNICIINDSINSVFVECYRVIRQILSFSMLNDSLSFHASGCVFQDNLYAFIGDKGSGKTTFNMAMLSLLKNKIDYFCNDKMFFNPVSKISYHWPECPAITYQTLCMFDNILERIDKVNTITFDTANVFINHPPVPKKDIIIGNSDSLKKIYLTNKQFCFLLNVNCRSYCKLNCFIYLEREYSDACKLIKCSEQEAKLICEKNYSDYSEFNNWLEIKIRHKPQLAPVPRVYRFYRTGNIKKDCDFLYDNLFNK